MSDTVKLIIEISKSDYKAICANKEDAIIAHDTCLRIAHGTPLDRNNPERAEAQAYFDGEAYGWEQGRKALIDEVKAEIEGLSNANPSYWHSGDMVEREEVLEIIEKYKGDKE